jgi:hypothetical protein
MEISRLCLGRQQHLPLLQYVERVSRADERCIYGLIEVLLGR